MPGLTLVWIELFDIERADSATAEKAIEVGQRHVNELMSWLDWSVWVECKPGCAPGVRRSISLNPPQTLGLTD
jgi:hypothetical protein